MTEKHKNPVINLAKRLGKGAMSVSCGFGAIFFGGIAYEEREIDLIYAALAGGLGISSLVLAKSALAADKENED